MSTRVKCVEMALIISFVMLLCARQVACRANYTIGFEGMHHGTNHTKNATNHTNHHIRTTLPPRQHYHPIQHLTTHHTTSKPKTTHRTVIHPHTTKKVHHGTNHTRNSTRNTNHHIRTTLPPHHNIITVTPRQQHPVHHLTTHHTTSKPKTTHRTVIHPHTTKKVHHGTNHTRNSTRNTNHHIIRTTLPPRHNIITVTPHQHHPVQHLTTHHTTSKPKTTHRTVIHPQTTEKVDPGTSHTRNYTRNTNHHIIRATLPQRQHIITVTPHQHHSVQHLTTHHSTLKPKPTHHNMVIHPHTTVIRTTTLAPVVIQTGYEVAPPELFQFSPIYKASPGFHVNNATSARFETFMRQHVKHMREEQKLKKQVQHSASEYYFTVHNHYNKRLMGGPSVENVKFGACKDVSTANIVCLPNTTAICSKGGKIMCVSPLKSAFQCKNNVYNYCINAKLPFYAEDITCIISNEGLKNLTIPCVGLYRIYNNTVHSYTPPVSGFRPISQDNAVDVVCATTVVIPKLYTSPANALFSLVFEIGKDFDSIRKPTTLLPTRIVTTMKTRL